MPESCPATLRLGPGAVYRNLMGVEMTAVEPAYLSNRLPALGLAAFDGVLGNVWVMACRDELWGDSRHLATPDGLAACGYELVSTPEEAL